MNDIVAKLLEIIFGVWFVNCIMSILFGIDIIDYVHKLLDRIIYGKTPSDDD